MAYEYEEEKKAQSAHHPAKAAGTSGAGSSSAAQLPAWTDGAGSPMHEEERTVRQWLNRHVRELARQSQTLSQLVQCVLDSVPAAVKLSRAQIETIICEWAADHDIPILRSMPPATGHNSATKSVPGQKEREKKA